MSSFFNIFLPVVHLWEFLIKNPLDWLLNNIYVHLQGVPLIETIGAYGVAIIVATIMIRLLLAPLPQLQLVNQRRTMAEQRTPAHPGLRLADLPAARGGDHLRAVEDAAAAGAGQPDRPGAADAADAADDGLFVPADDRVLRAAGACRPGPLLVCRQLRQYHSA